jgi:hypothetical protein
MQDEHLPPADPVIEHWDGFKLLGRHWKSRSGECALCGAPEQSQSQSMPSESVGVQDVSDVHVESDPETGHVEPETA